MVIMILNTYLKATIFIQTSNNGLKLSRRKSNSPYTDIMSISRLTSLGTMMFPNSTRYGC